MDWKNSTSRTAALAICAAALCACGGGGGGDSSIPPARSPDSSGAATPPAGTPAPVDRIEPYDTAAASAARVAPSAWRAMSAEQARSMLRQVVLPPLGTPQAQARSAQAIAVQRAGDRAPVQIGITRALDATADAEAFTSQLQWADTPTGSRVAAVSFQSPQAKGVRLGVQVRQLPAQAVLRFYAQDGSGAASVTQVTSDEFSAISARNLLAGVAEDEARTVWSPDFGGAETTLEIELPATAPVQELRLSVPRLSHFTVSPSEAGAVGSAERCEVDVNCRSGHDAESRSVARMTFVSAGASFLCTGTLLNDAAASGTPYLLSARHCINTQAEASSLVTDWFLRSQACGSANASNATRRLSGGAALLHVGTATDTSLVKLLEKPPAGVVYAGSYFGTPVAEGTPVEALHHPSGDLQKLSLGRMLNYSQCADFNCQGSTAALGEYYSVQWSEGVTEQGSSGSALFLPLGSTRYVVGQLSGGASSCVRREGLDHYGRFDRAYREALHQWLNPA